MMKLEKRILYIIIFILCSVYQLSAENISFSASTSRLIYKGEKFQVTYTLTNSEIDTFTPAQIKGAKLIYGPTQSGTQSSMVMVNGKTTSSTATLYTVTYLAETIGKTEVPSITVNVKGQNYSSKKISIEILDPSERKNNQGTGDPFFDSFFDDGFDEMERAEAPKISPKDVFIRAIFSKGSVYEQEAVICTIKLYTKHDIASIIASDAPTFNGFIIEKLPVSSSFTGTEKINGAIYKVAELDKYILFPQQTGKLPVSSGEYGLTVRTYQKMSSRWGGYSLVPYDSKIKISSDKATLNVKCLPEPKPASFTGAVGSYNIKSTLSSKPLKTFEASDYTLTISGTGNLKYIKAPTVNFPSQFEAYDPQTVPNVSAAGTNMKGTLECKYTFVPQYIGKFTIPKVEFSYFDPGKNEYVTISTEEYNVSVAKGNNSNAAVVQNNSINEKNKDILIIKRNGYSLTKDISFIVSSPAYWIWYILPIILLIVILFIYRKTLKERANIQLMKTKHAGKVAKKRLKNAKRFMDMHENSKFYSELLTALWGYLSDKLRIPVSNLNKENIAIELEKYGIDEKQISDVITLLNECEFAQYAPEQTDAQMETLYTSASNIMNNIENSKKKVTK